jgi:hypothetical protein
MSARADLRCLLCEKRLVCSTEKTGLSAIADVHIFEEDCHAVLRSVMADLHLKVSALLTSIDANGLVRRDGYCTRQHGDATAHCECSSNRGGWCELSQL